MQECWEIFSYYLNIVSQKYLAKIIAFVLMSNHFHLMLHTPKENIDEIMNYLLREVSKTIGRRSNRINHIFGARYARTVIQTEIYFYHAYKYLYRNPSEALIVDKIENYAYSTYPAILNQGKVSFPVYDLDIFPNDLIPKDLNKRLEWLNESYDSKEKLLIKNALRRPIFELPKGKNVIATVNKLLMIPQKVDGTLQGIVL